MGKRELPEPAVLRITVELAPPPFRGRHQDEPSRHQPQDPLIDLIVDRSGREVGPCAGEQALVGLQVSELGVHEQANYQRRTADSSNRRERQRNCWRMRLMREKVTFLQFFVSILRFVGDFLHFVHDLIDTSPLYAYRD